MEEDSYGMEYRKYMSQLYPNLTAQKLDAAVEIMLQDLKAARQDPGSQHVLGGPLLDILSITIRPTIPPPTQGNWRIAGNIHVSQKSDLQRGIPKDVTHLLFQTDSHNSQILNPRAPFLSLHHASPIFSFFPLITLSLNLTAKRRKNSQLLTIFDGSLPLDYTDYQDDMFDKVLHHDFKAPKADLCVKYITYRAACIAELNFSLDVPVGQQPRQLKVSGKIHASWHHTKDDFEPHVEHERHCSCVCLFDTSGDILVTTGHPFQLIRSFVAVPSYATLVLEIVLNIEGVDSFHIIDFPVEDMDISKLEFKTSQGFVARCNVRWESEYLYQYGEEEEEETTTETSGTQVPKSICFHDTVLDMRLYGERMMEIFSIFVGAKAKSTRYCLNGTIDVNDSSGTHRIFGTNDNLTRRFTHGMTLPLVGPESCLKGTYFLQLNLKEDNGQEFCRGYMGWNIPLLRPPWLNKLLCSVIKGELGYAAIYYAHHTSAVSCAVNVFLAAPSRCENVYMSGLIAGEYDIEYTTFEKKYYRSFLFHKEEEYALLEFRANRQLVNIPKSRSIEIKHNKYWMSVPLSKSMVAVSTDNTLVIDVNLSVGCDNIDVAPAQKLMGSMEFHIGRKTWHMINNDDYQMFVSVDWS